MSMPYKTTENPTALACKSKWISKIIKEKFYN